MKTMKLSLTIGLVIVLLNQTYSQSDLNLSANYETIGATLLLNSIDPEKDAYANLEYKESSTNEWIVGFPLSRVNNDLNMCSGSIFWLQPNTSYDVRLEIIDATTPELNGQIIAETVTTKAEPNFHTVSGITWNVSTTGEGEFLHLQEAINMAQAGDLILLDTGVYYVGNITFPNNGTALNPIQIKGIIKDGVILNGAYETPHTWTPYGGAGVYQTTTSAINPNLIIADGVRLFPHKTYPELLENKIVLREAPLKEYPAEVGGFYRNPTLVPILLFFNYGDPIAITTHKLYIKFLDGSDPNTKNIEITKRANCFKFQDNEHITIGNLTFKNYGLGSIATAIILSNSNNILIDSCDFKANNTSIKLSTGTNNVLIQHCSFKDYFFNWNAWKIKSTQDLGTPFDVRFPGNSRNLERGAIVYAHDFYGDNIVFRKNHIQDYHQGGHITPEASVLDTMAKSLNIDFYENTIINCRGDGFEVDGNARNIRVFKNKFHGCHAPLSLAAAQEGPVYIMRNTFSNLISDYYDNPVGDLNQAKGHPLKFQVSGGLINGDIHFYHNTVNAQNMAYGMNVYQVTTEDAWKKLDSKNNIFIADAGIGLNVNTISGMPNFTSDYNNYHSSNTDISCVSLDNASTDCFSTIPDLNANYGWEEHSLQTEPEFVDAANGDYHLSSESPMIDSGIIIQGINENAYNGLKPDMGAFESSSPVSVSEIEEEYIKIYPNPSNGLLNVELIKANEDWTYAIFDIYGKLLLGSDLNNQNAVIDMSHFSAGTYVIQVRNEHKVLSKRLVKTR